MLQLLFQLCTSRSLANWNEHFGDKEQFWQENVSLDLTSKNTEKIFQSKRRHWDGKCHLSGSLFYSISMFLCNRNDGQRASRFANCSNALREAFAATAVRSRVESLYLVCTFREETHRCPVAGFTCILDVMDILGWSFVFSLSRNMERDDFWKKRTNCWGQKKPLKTIRERGCSHSNSKMQVSASAYWKRSR